jgi:hypothetical protein
MLMAPPYAAFSTMPFRNPFVERVIGRIRRGPLDQVFFWTAMDLERKLLNYQRYFNQHRTHTSQNGHPPVSSGTENCADLNHFQWQAHCRGLLELPIAAKIGDSP